MGAIKAPTKYSLVGGPFGSKLGRKDYVSHGIPVIRGANLPDNGRFSFDGFVFVGEDREHDFRSNLAFPGDLIITQRGTLGQVGLIPDDSPYPRFVISQSQMKLTVDRAVAEPQYVYYYLRSPEAIAAIHGMSMVAGVPHINLGLFESMDLPLQPLSTQRKITAILSAYDDLIENNNRRIKVLEDMAQCIYREWFMDFRYPGHENVPLVESALGPIPEGWETGTLSDLVDVNANTIRQTDVDEEIRYIDIASVARGVVQQPKKMLLSEAPGRARRRVAEGDILWSTVRPNLRAYALFLSSATDCVASTGFAVLSPRRVSFAYVYVITTTDAFVEYLTGRATGSAYPAVTPPVFVNAPITIPHHGILKAFADVAEPLMRLASRLGFQVDTLRATRDLLLPLVTSGKVDVTDLDIAMPQAAA